MREARDAYASWGATAKVADLEQRHPDILATRPVAMPDLAGRTIGTGYSSTIASTRIDQLGVLKTSQALSSETDLNRLRRRVKEVLQELTAPPM